MVNAHLSPLSLTPHLIREIITGEIPYYNLNVNEIIFKVGWEGKHVEIPSRGNPLILQIMKMCLDFERTKRPTFKEIIDTLQKDTRKSKVNRDCITNNNDS